MKKWIVATAMSAAMLGTAAAQTTAPGPMKDQSMPPSAMPSATLPSTPSFVSTQGTEQWLASSFEGTDVVGPQDEKIGDVSDVLFDKDGKVIAYVVGVGGFLGIGAKDVALAPSSFQLIPGQNANDYKLRLSMTKEQLQNATAFEPLRTQASTTGSGTTTRPANAPTPAPAPAR